MIDSASGGDLLGAAASSILGEGSVGTTVYALPSMYNHDCGEVLLCIVCSFHHYIFCHDLSLYQFFEPAFGYAQYFNCTLLEFVYITVQSHLTVQFYTPSVPIYCTHLVYDLLVKKNV